MPKMDGVTFLKRFMPVMPTPTVIISSLTQAGKRVSLEALEAGAVDVVAKPVLGLVDGLPLMLDDICRRVKAAANTDVSRFARRGAASTVEPVSSSLEETTDRVIAIGDAPGVVIVQHMPMGFTASFAERLDRTCQMHAKEAEAGDRVMPGRILLAPGGARHMSVLRSGGEYRIALKEGEEVNYSRPAVDVLFLSVAGAVGRNAAAALLTGMGRDGAAGLLAIRQAGGRTYAQDEASSVVFGMPAAAQRLGGAEAMAPLEKIPALLVRALRTN
jgi:two-component system chemotaxis response regulator CheB